MKGVKATLFFFFLMGIGHVKSGIVSQLNKYKNAIYLDVGSSIDALAGIIDIHRPYFGDWTNYKLKNYDYSKIDFLKYKGQGKKKIL